VRRLLVVLLALVVVPSATAAFSVTLTSTSPQTFAGITLNGVDQTQTLNISITVANTPPSNGNGWNVTAAAGLPTNGTNTLPALIVTGVTAGPCSGGSCSNPTNSVTWPQTLTAGGVKIFNAAAGTDRGTVVLTATVEMTYVAKALAGTYSTTLTVTGVNSGP
jgi:hypothetical protein